MTARRKTMAPDDRIDKIATAALDSLQRRPKRRPQRDRRAGTIGSRRRTKPVVEGIRRKERTTRTLKGGSIYHGMNSTCIHLRAKDPNIYMYRRGKYIKNPLKKYNNRKG
jgi:hypothetical protein